MSPSHVSESQVLSIAGIVADAADQYLISYILLTRFVETTPYSLIFTLAHCIELSIKAAYWNVNRTSPGKTHGIDQLLERLPALKAEAEKYLPSQEMRKQFRDQVDEINRAQGSDMIKALLAINPNLNDDNWQLLYSLDRSVHVKYGVDNNSAVLQLVSPVVPKLNVKALKLIGCARRLFIAEDQHRTTLVKFMRKLDAAGALRHSIIERLQEHTNTGRLVSLADPNPPKSLISFEPDETALLKGALLL